MVLDAEIGMNWIHSSPPYVLNEDKIEHQVKYGKNVLLVLPCKSLHSLVLLVIGFFNI